MTPQCNMAVCSAARGPCTDKQGSTYALERVARVVDPDVVHGICGLDQRPSLAAVHAGVRRRRRGGPLDADHGDADGQRRGVDHPARHHQTDHQRSTQGDCRPRVHILTVPLLCTASRDGDMLVSWLVKVWACWQLRTTALATHAQRSKQQSSRRADREAFRTALIGFARGELMRGATNGVAAPFRQPTR